jgi:hypothetical protein
MNSAKFGGDMLPTSFVKVVANETAVVFLEYQKPP